MNVQNVKPSIDGSIVIEADAFALMAVTSTCVGLVIMMLLAVLAGPLEIAGAKTPTCMRIMH